MKAETQYKVGHKFWAMVDNKPQEIVVTEVVVKWTTQYGELPLIYYKCFITKGGNYYDDLKESAYVLKFTTLDELLNSFKQ